MMEMRAPLSDADLQAALLACLPGEGENRPVRLVARRFNPFSSRSVTEIASCQRANGQVQEVLVKYEADDDGASGHRGGIKREGLAYERILGPLALPPFCFGRGVEPGTGRNWLALEYISDSCRVSKAPQPEALRAAAQWLAQFHSRGQALLSLPALEFLPRYDLSYFMSWVARSIAIAGNVKDRYPWFADICVRAADAFQLLSAAPLTIVHGEFFPQNVLWRSNSIYTVDWESAAAAPAEIDLASLVEGWSPTIRTVAIADYCASRRIDARDSDLLARLAAARMYWAYRWLGNSAEWARSDGWYRSFDVLRAAACDFGLLADA
jgi:Phosphotransferase enzyme family